MNESYRPAKIAAGAAAAATVIWLGSGWIAGGGESEHRDNTYDTSSVPGVEPTPAYDSSLDQIGPEVAEEYEVDETGLTIQDLAQFAIEGVEGSGSEIATQEESVSDDVEDDSDNPCLDGYAPSKVDGNCVPESDVPSDEYIGPSEPTTW